MEHALDVADLELPVFVPFLVDEEAFGSTLCEAELEVLYEILKVSLVSQVVAARVEPVDIDVVRNLEGPQPPSQPILARQVVVVIEVVYALPALQHPVVYVNRLGRPLEVIELGPHILVFCPSFLHQGAPQLVVASFHNENLLVLIYSILPLPSR